MASVRIGRQIGSVGFTKTVAVKLLHQSLADDATSSAILRDEARVMSRIRHPNVIDVLDLVAADGQLALVMEYVPGESLSRVAHEMRQRAIRIPTAIAVTIVRDALRGLQAAHEAVGDQGEPLGLVHRDVSPQNILVGADGICRMLDFGIAKAAGRLQVTLEHGSPKGKPSYMAPEQLRDQEVDARTDIWAASVVLWECLTGYRLFQGDNDVAIVRKVIDKPIDPPSQIVENLPHALDLIVLRGLQRDPTQRFPCAAEMADALGQAVAPASTHEVSEWLSGLLGEELAARDELVRSIEAAALDRPSQPSRTPPLPARRSGLRTILVSAGAVALVLAAASVPLLRASRDTARAPVDPAPMHAATSSAAAAPSLSIPAPSQVASALPSARPSAELPRADDPPVRASASATPATSRERTRPANCDPPYVVDSEGFLKVKSECM
ncbi:MAG: serine/threonine protein kinase [Deltaproteobacteria bacterium]|nr:serine/threonine protein kinase [Deltaproteobacteria bacterium]